MLYRTAVLISCICVHPVSSVCVVFLGRRIWICYISGFFFVWSCWSWPTYVAGTNPKEITSIYRDCPMGFDQDLPIRRMTMEHCCPSRLYYLILRILLNEWWMATAAELIKHRALRLHSVRHKHKHDKS